MAEILDIRTSEFVAKTQFLWNKKKPAAEIIRMGAMLANKDAV